MRLRSRVLLTAGLACLSTAVVAGGALAHGGGHESKIGKTSKRGHSDLRVEVRGAITQFTAPDATNAGSVTVSAAQVDPTAPVPLAAPGPVPATSLVWQCAIPAGSSVSGFNVGDIVKLRCRSVNGVLTAYKLKARHDHRGGMAIKDRGHGKGRFSVEVEARGAVVKADQTSITVDPGTTTDQLAPFTCAIGPRTRSFGMLMAGDTVKIKCKTRDGALVAKKIKKKGAMTIGEIQVKVKAPIDTVGPTGITFVGGTSCAVADPSLVTGLAQGDFVEAKCTGNPLTLAKIQREDDDH